MLKFFTGALFSIAMLGGALLVQRSYITSLIIGDLPVVANVSIGSYCPSASVCLNSKYGAVVKGVSFGDDGEKNAIGLPSVSSDGIYEGCGRAPCVMLAR